MRRWTLNLAHVLGMRIYSNGELEEPRVWRESMRFSGQFVNVNDFARGDLTKDDFALVSNY